MYSSPVSRVKLIRACNLPSHHAIAEYMTIDPSSVSCQVCDGWVGSGECPRGRMVASLGDGHSSTIEHHAISLMIT